jgi:hypothetical protein
LLIGLLLHDAKFTLFQGLFPIGLEPSAMGDLEDCSPKFKRRKNMVKPLTPNFVRINDQNRFPYSVTVNGLSEREKAVFLQKVKDSLTAAFAPVDHPTAHAGIPSLLIMCFCPPCSLVDVHARGKYPYANSNYLAWLASLFLDKRPPDRFCSKV